MLRRKLNDGIENRIIAIHERSSLKRKHQLCLFQNYIRIIMKWKRKKKLIRLGTETANLKSTELQCKLPILI